MSTTVLIERFIKKIPRGRILVKEKLKLRGYQRSKSLLRKGINLFI